MGLGEIIRAEATKALKSGDKFRYETLKLLLASLQNKEIEKQGKVGLGAALTDEEAQQVVLGEMKKRREAVEVYQEAGRHDLAEQEEKELVIISAYAPRQLSEPEIRKELEELISHLGGKEFGILMKECGQRFKGRAEMGLVAKIAKELYDSRQQSYLSEDKSKKD